MSSFEVLKYGGIDLASTAALLTLPQGVLDEYYRLANNGYGLNESNTEKVEILSYLYVYSRYTPGVSASTTIRRHFNRALSKYEVASN